MKSHVTPQTAYLSLRIPRTLAADLRRAASREANTQSAVARRLIAIGLQRELGADNLEAVQSLPRRRAATTRSSARKRKPQNESLPRREQWPVGAQKAVDQGSSRLAAAWPTAIATSKIG